jgi:hypothetical protein
MYRMRVLAPCSPSLLHTQPNQNRFLTIYRQKMKHSTPRVRVLKNQLDGVRSAQHSIRVRVWNRNGVPELEAERWRRGWPMKALYDPPSTDETLDSYAQGIEKPTTRWSALRTTLQMGSCVEPKWRTRMESRETAWRMEAEMVAMREGWQPRTLPPALATAWHLESKRASRPRRSAHLLLRSPFPSLRCNL